MKESDVQRAILDHLALKRIFHYRNNSGGFRDAANHFYRFGAIGSPDIVCVVKGQYVGFKVKAPGGRQSEHQKEFQWGLEEAGGRYISSRIRLDDVITLTR